MVTASSLLLVEDVAGDGVRGVLECSALLVMKGMLSETSCLVDFEKPSAETSSRVYMIAILVRLGGLPLASLR